MAGDRALRILVVEEDTIAIRVAIPDFGVGRSVDPCGPQGDGIVGVVHAG